MKEQLQKAFAFRQAVKKYSDRKIESDKWETIKDSIYWAPSSHGWEPYRVLIINRENPLRQELKEAMYGQGITISADKMVYFISLDHKTFTSDEWVYARTLRVEKELKGLKGAEAEVEAKKEFDFIKSFIDEKLPHNEEWAQKQAYIAIGMAMETASLLGVGSTAIEGSNRKEVKEILLKHGLIKENEEIAIAAAFGYAFNETSYQHWGSGKRVRDKKEYKFTEV